MIYKGRYNEYSLEQGKANNLVISHYHLLAFKEFDNEMAICINSLFNSLSQLNMQVKEITKSGSLNIKQSN